MTDLLLFCLFVVIPLDNLSLSLSVAHAVTPHGGTAPTAPSPSHKHPSNAVSGHASSPTSATIGAATAAFDNAVESIAELAARHVLLCALPTRGHMVPLQRIAQVLHVHGSWLSSLVLPVFGRGVDDLLWG